MNAMHVHLILNHLPVVGALFGLGLFACGGLRKSEDLKKAALVVFVAVAIFSIPVYLTGEPAEDGVKGLPGVSETILEKHEQAGGVTFVLLLVLGSVGLLSLFIFRAGKVIPAALNAGILAMSLVVLGFSAWTANLGGQVRHTEIRPGATAPQTDAEHEDEREH